MASKDLNEKALIRKRGTIRAGLTHFETFLNKYHEGDSENVFTLESRLKRVESDFEMFEKLQEELESLGDDEWYETQLLERAETEEKYYMLVGRARGILHKEQAKNTTMDNSLFEQTIMTQVQQPLHNPIVEHELPTTSNIRSPMNIPVVNATETHVKIPTMHLPKFSGSYEAWPGFCDTFKSSIHDNPNFRDTQKLIYLRSCLSGKAAEKIESLETTAANYLVAWDILERNYDDPIALINNRIKAFFELPHCQKSSSQAISDILDESTKHYRALTASNQPFFEAFPIYAVVSKLDEHTRLKWKEHIQGNRRPTMEDVLTFLQNRKKILEDGRFETRSNKIQMSNPRSHSNSHRQATFQSAAQKHHTLSYASQFKPQRTMSCHLCPGAHYTQFCDQLVKATVTQRADIVNKARLCYNCLRPNHVASDCGSGGCKKCGAKHHTILHKEKTEPNEPKTSITSLNTTIHSQTLLSTALINVLDRDGTPQTCRVLLDSGSQAHFISEKFATYLQLPRKEINVSVAGINATTAITKSSIDARIQSRFNRFTANLTFLILPRITEKLPSQSFNKLCLDIPSNIRLADPGCHISSEIDGIIGAELFFKALCVGQIRVANQSVILNKTHFGWVISGKIPLGTISQNVSCNLAIDQLHTQLAKFWEVEEGPKERILSGEEDACELHFSQTTRRDRVTGRYIVRLPFKESHLEFGESYTTARKRFFNLERSLSKNHELKSQYTQFLREYEQLGHMSIVDNPNISEGYYLPHHAVLKPGSKTSKLRVVFDASATTSTGTSLNKTLMTGPTIQEDLFSLIVRFRSHQYALTADIEKMYRQILVDENDRQFQKILWRETTTEPLRTYTLNTVTYGTSAAPFLAIRSLRQLSNDEAENFPKASTILAEDFYVDDLLTGADTLEEVVALRRDLQTLCHKGGFHLRQWASNDPYAVTQCNEVSPAEYIDLDHENPKKTLGVHWNVKHDSISYSVNDNETTTTITKRTILSEIAKLFDPLGLLGPVIIRAKIIMQQLWQNKLDWDQSLPMDIHSMWVAYKRELNLLREIRIPRNLLIYEYVSVQLHGMCDASERAYGACIYIRSRDRNQRTVSRLVCAKSRVAPLKTLTLPRLELCAAVLLAKLFKTTSLALRRIKFEKVVFWSDSTIALNWINTAPCLLKTFVAHRVAEIQQLTMSHEWRHISSQDNPADLLSRGLNTREFVDNPLWFHGPVWLNEPESEWPDLVLEPIEIPETRSLVSLPTKLASGSIFSKFSSYVRLKRVVAYILRFIFNTTHKQRRTGTLGAHELHYSTRTIIKVVQNEELSKELCMLKSGKRLDGNFASLNPFLDDDNIMRVGGRLCNSELPYDEKFPMLLPRDHEVTALIIRHEHVNQFHAGPQATLNAIRKTFRIPCARKRVKQIIHKCVRCFRAKPGTVNYIMGNLPKHRVVVSRPFLHVGVDYCGPLFIKEKLHRNRNKIKVYLAVFVCFSTKAIHIEIVGDLTTEAFLSALKRFFARRGKCTDIYSDNATNFTGAKATLKELHELLNSENHKQIVTDSLANLNINWHLIPPRSPHFGGLWEAAVKSLKYHLTRVVGETLLSYEGLLTYVNQIEAILYSRPLTPMSSDPNDVSAITPGHFLIGNSLTSVPDNDFQSIPDQRLSSWELVQKMRQHFWTRWSKEYLNELTVRKKWHNTSSESQVKIGTLVVLKEDNVPPMRWPLARVTEVFPDAQGIVRVVVVKTSRGSFKRAVKKLSPLPIDSC